MGDMLTLIEKAQQEFDDKAARSMEKKLREQSFTLEDFLEQFAQIKKMGSMQDILGMIPGGNKIQAGDIDERQINKVEAIIRSMTPRERRHPELLQASRKRRIAAGSGTSVQQVNQLLRQFEQIRKMMKQFGGKGGKRKLMRGFGSF